MESINSNPESQIEELPKRVLEIGAGVMSVVELLKGSRKEISNAIVSDINKKWLINDREGSPKVAADVYNLPFGDNSFEYIIAKNFFGDPDVSNIMHGREYVPVSFSKIESMFKELSRVLSNGGEVCVVETYTPDYAVTFFNRYKEVYEKYFSYVNEADLISEKDLFEIIHPWKGEDNFVHALKKKN